MAKSTIKEAEYKNISEVPIERAFLESMPGLGQQNNRVYARHISSGVMRGEQNLGDGNVKIDSSNRRILIYDEDGNARVLVGYDEDGF